MSLAVYTDSGATVKDSSFNTGDMLYINGDATSQYARTGITIVLEIFNSSDVLQATPLDTTHNFPANTNQNIKTDVNGGVSPSVDLTGYAEGQYYVRQTISGINVETIYTYEDFLITDTVPVPSPVSHSSCRRISMSRILRTYKTNCMTTDAIIHVNALGETRNQFGSIDHSAPGLIDAETFAVTGVLMPYDRYMLRNEFSDGYDASHVLIIDTYPRFFDCDYLMFVKEFTYTMSAVGYQTTGHPVFEVTNLFNCSVVINDTEDGIVAVTPSTPGVVAFDAYIDKMAVKKVEEVDNHYMVLYLGAWSK